MGSLVNHVQLKDVYGDAEGFDNGRYLWYTNEKLRRGCWKLYFPVSENSLGALAQTRSLSVIYDILMPAQHMPCIPVWMQTYLQNGEWQNLAHCYS